MRRTRRCPVRTIATHPDRKLTCDGPAEWPGVHRGETRNNERHHRCAASGRPRPGVHVSSDLLYTRWQELHTKEWTPWVPFSSPKGSVVESTAATQLSDNQIILLVVDEAGQPWLRQKLSPTQSDAFFADWEKFGEIKAPKKDDDGRKR